MRISYWSSDVCSSDLFAVATSLRELGAKDRQLMLTALDALLDHVDGVAGSLQAKLDAVSGAGGLLSAARKSLATLGARGKRGLGGATTNSDLTQQLLRGVARLFRRLSLFLGSGQPCAAGPTALGRAACWERGCQDV